MALFLAPGRTPADTRVGQATLLVGGEALKVTLWSFLVFRHTKPGNVLCGW